MFSGQLGAYGVNSLDDLLAQRARDLKVAVVGGADGHRRSSAAGGCNARTLPSASAETNRVPSGPAVIPANGPCGPENGGKPLSGLGTTPGGAPTGNSAAIVRRAPVSRSNSINSLALASTM